MMSKILIINTGSRSTKIGFFENDKLIDKYEIQHTNTELSKYKSIGSQLQFRKDKIAEILSDSKTDLSSIDAISCIGGILKPLQGGVYLVNKKMVNDIMVGNVQAEHASNLAACIGYEMTENLHIPCYIADPISTDELDPIARITGIPDIPKFSRTHALNVKARVRTAAKEIGKKVEELVCIVAHIGGGLTINLVKNGKIIDIEDARQFGPMSPESAGAVPLPDFAQFCFKGKYSEKEIIKFWYGKGGFVAHLGTGSIIEVEKRIAEGEQKAKQVYEAMIYQIAKSIGALYVAAECNIDAIILTGGGTHSKMLVELLKTYVKKLGKIYVYPGEEELLTLGKLADTALNKKIQILEYN